MKPLYYYLFSALLLAGSAYYHATRYERVVEEVYYPLANELNQYGGFRTTKIIEYAMLHPNRYYIPDSLVRSKDLVDELDTNFNGYDGTLHEIVYARGPAPREPYRPAGKINTAESRKLASLHQHIIQKAKAIIAKKEYSKFKLKCNIDSLYEIKNKLVFHDFGHLSAAEQYIWFITETAYIRFLHHDLLIQLYYNQKKAATQNQYEYRIAAYGYSNNKKRGVDVYFSTLPIIKAMKNHTIQHLINNKIVKKEPNETRLFYNRRNTDRLTITTILTDTLNKRTETFKNE
jgi:hypothetical protein